MRREMSQKRTVTYGHMEQCVNGEEMLWTHLFRFRKNNYSQCLNFVCVTININRKFCDLRGAKIIVTASESYVKDGAMSTACVAYENISPPPILCSFFRDQETSSRIFLQIKKGTITHTDCTW